MTQVLYAHMKNKKKRFVCIFVIIRNIYKSSEDNWYKLTEALKLFSEKLNQISYQIWYLTDPFQGRIHFVENGDTK
jgi:hypothetical protein